MKSLLKTYGKWTLAILGLVVGIALLSPLLAILLRVVYVTVIHE